MLDQLAKGAGENCEARLAGRLAKQAGRVAE